jgi:hypothetical protein
LAVISVIAALVLVSSVAVSAWLFTQQNTGKIVIQGSGAALFLDSGCTQPLTPATVLDYGQLRNSSNSTITVSLWLKATGTDSIRPTIAVTGLPAYIGLFENTLGQITSTPTLLYTPASVTWAAGAYTCISDGAITAGQTTVVAVSGPFGTPPTWIKFADNGEYCAVTAMDAPAKTLTIVRGQGGSTATPHASGASFTFGTLTVIPEAPLQPGEVRPVVLKLRALLDLTPYLGATVTAWQIIFTATSDY